MKNGILTFICAFVPGAGQMYQGYMKRGLTLITLFCIGFGLYYIFAPLGVFMLVVWMYSFFDTFNLRAQIGAGTAPADDYLVIDHYDAAIKRALGEGHKLLGWALIGLGVLIFYQNILMNTVGDIVYRWGKNSAFFRAVYLALDSLPEIAVCVVLVLCGVWLVRGPRSAKRPRSAAAEEPQPEEFLAYHAQQPAGDKIEETGIDLTEPQTEEAYNDDNSDEANSSANAGADEQ